MMRRWWPNALAGLLAYLLFMLIRLPADQAYSVLAPRLGLASAGVQLGGLEGTLWQGRATRFGYKGALLGSLQWELSPWRLLRGQIGADYSLQSEDGYIQGYVMAPIAGGELQFETTQGRLPLQELQRYFKGIPLPLEGSLSLNLPRFALGEERHILAAEGTVVWHQAGVSVPQALSFGDIRMALAQVDEGIEGTISDGGGPLRIQAKLHLSPEGAYRLTGTVAAAEGAPKELAQSLGMLGKPDGEGRYPLNFNGRF